MDLVLQKFKNDTESTVDVERKSVSPRQQHSPMDASSSGGCSRRAILKQRKFCHQCKRRPASIVESPAESGGPLRFCSNSCLDTYKLEIFTKETLLCLQNGPSASGSSHSPVGAHSTSSSGGMVAGGVGGKQRGGRTGERVVASPTKTRKRGHHPRPHPSYRLNKRYWDDLRAGRIVEGNSSVETPRKRKSEEIQPTTAVATSTALESAPATEVIQIATSAPSFVVPISASRTPESKAVFQPAAASQPVAASPVSIASPATTVHQPHEQQQQQQLQQPKKCSSLFNELIIIPIPIPILFPLPFPLTEKFILDKYGRL